MRQVQIRPFRPGDEAQIVEVILPIQQEEFSIPITVDAQPDLLDVQKYYVDSGGAFFVAEIDGKVVGTVALLNIGNGRAALRKMFVRSDYRGAAWGVARRLLETLLAWATSHAFFHVYLGTTDKFLAAHRFYEKNGFTRIEVGDLPKSFPIMKVDSIFYERALTPEQERASSTPS